jgi:hypothetical protein
MSKAEDFLDLESLRIPLDKLPKSKVITGRRLIWDSVKRKHVSPAELSAAYEGFDFVLLPAESFAQLAVDLQSPELAVLFKLYRNWFSRYRKNPLPLARIELKGFPVSRGQKRRALEVLQKAGLISVKYRPGKNPLVRLLWLNKKP